MNPKTPKADPVSVCDLLPESDSVALVPSEAQLRAEGKKFRAAIIPTGAEPWYLCKFRGVRIYAGADAVKMLQAPGALQILGTLGQGAKTNEAPAETLIKHLTGPTKRACNIIRQRHGDQLDEMFVAYCIPSLNTALMLDPRYRKEQEEKAERERAEERHGELLAALPARKKPKPDRDTQDQYNEERSALIVACEGRGTGCAKKQWIADTKKNPAALPADARRAWDRLSKGVGAWTLDADAIPKWWGNMESAERAAKTKNDKRESKAATARRKTTRSKP